ncbi:hypothetical protein [Streptomyces hirsutus]|uniref:hypothetical protein n=1 Tax=Streptomyces hirsutus TaxID=35620 RepID=UPI0036999EF8
MTLFEHDFVAAGSTERPVGGTGRMLQMMTGYRVTQVVRTAAESLVARTRKFARIGGAQITVSAGAIPSLPHRPRR